MRNDNLECKIFGGIEGTLYLRGDVYVKTEEVKEKLLDVARRLGYEIKEAEEGPYATLKTTHFAQCEECQGAMSRKSIGHVYCQCPHCNKVIFDKYPKGGIIQFDFKHADLITRGGLAFHIFDVDTDRNILQLYPVPLLESEGQLRIGIWDVRNMDDAEALLNDAEALELIKRAVVEDDDGQMVEVIEIHFNASPYIAPDDVIEARDIIGSVQNFSMMREYDGHEFHSLLGGPPGLPQSFHIYDTYIGGMRLSLADPKAHEFILRMGGISNIVHDSRDSDFRDPIAHKRMTAYIEHFVDVDPEVWREFLDRATLETPAFYYELAQWCANNSDGKERVVRHHLHEGFALPKPQLVRPHGLVERLNETPDTPPSL